MNPETERQQVLFVWTAGASLASRIVGWSLYDGNDVDAGEAVVGDLRHERGVDVLADGWRLIQFADVGDRPVAPEHVTGTPAGEWVFERIVHRHDPRRR